jgi:hypothetical protein
LIVFYSALPPKLPPQVVQDGEAFDVVELRGR